ncbi:hypothetical protein BDR22DRAFT_505629 [Usnea florida]
MACYFSPGPLCDWCEHCNIQKPPVHHRRPFEPTSISPVTGITFKDSKYSANQLANGFENIIQGHMDSEIKRSALARWDELLPDLLDGPVWRDAEFDLKDSFHILDDFLFMRALQHRCRVEWVDGFQKGRKQNWLGWCGLEVRTNRGQDCLISLVRPTVDKPTRVGDVLSTLKHEMCHALMMFTCLCGCCRCPLNAMNGMGLAHHGPSWQKLRNCVESTASLYLDKLYESTPLSFTELEAETEENKVAKMLSGLYKKVTQQGSESAELKRVERAKRKTEEAEMVSKMEEEPDGGQQLDVLACASAMFEAFEREAFEHEGLLSASLASLDLRKIAQGVRLSGLNLSHSYQRHLLAREQQRTHG